MKHRYKNKKIISCFIFSFFILLTAGVISCNQKLDPTQARTITFALTNDIHGHLEPSQTKDKIPLGGLAYLASLIKQLRANPNFSGDYNGLVVLDSGDQFQGTLLSNYDEGATVFKAMQEMGYDAVVPGNHDYDFGPIGWLYDRVFEGKTSNDPREVIKKLSQEVDFPLLSANTYLKNSIRPKGTFYSVDLDSRCRPSNESLSTPLDFENASQPTFLRPYTIIRKAGVRIALIGLDHQNTASMTTVENVSDLCFRDEAETYIELRKKLEGQADIFVLQMHNGNTKNTFEGSVIAQKINQQFPNGDGVHLIAAGHTHFIHNDQVGNTPVIQNGAHATHFGIVRLTYRPDTRTVEFTKTIALAGIPIMHDTCLDSSSNICEQIHFPNLPNQNIQSMIEQLKEKIAPLTSRKLAIVTEPVTRSRTDESALGNILTDYLKKSAKTDLAIMNLGGIRTDLNPGTLNYESFFEVLPFNNQAVVMQEMRWGTLKKILNKAAQTCGRYGGLAFSGLKLTYTRNCSQNSDLDKNAKIEKVQTLSGELLYDSQRAFEVSETLTFSVVTLDFLSQGGSGYTEFLEAPITKTIGIARELIADELSQEVPTLSNTLDQRMQPVEIKTESETVKE